MLWRYSGNGWFRWWIRWKCGFPYLPERKRACSFSGRNKRCWNGSKSRQACVSIVIYFIHLLLNTYWHIFQRKWCCWIWREHGLPERVFDKRGNGSRIAQTTRKSWKNLDSLGEESINSRHVQNSTAVDYGWNAETVQDYWKLRGGCNCSARKDQRSKTSTSK